MLVRKLCVDWGEIQKVDIWRERGQDGALRTARERERVHTMHVSKRRIMAFMLSAGMLLPLAGCKKSGNSSKSKTFQYSSGQEVKETDPYFQAEVNKIILPKKEGLEIEYENIENCTLTGSAALVTYDLGYELPEGTRIEDLSYEEGAQYYINGTALYDEHGKLISELSDSSYYVNSVTTDQDGNFYILSGEFDQELGKMTLVIDVRSSEGEQVKRFKLPTVEYSDEAFTTSIQVLKDGSLAVFGKGGLTVVDPEGNEVCKVADPGRSFEKAVIQQDGKNYVVSGIYDPMGESSIQIKEVDLKTGALGKVIEADYLSAYSQPTVTDSGIYVSSTEGCKKLDLQTGEIETVFNWNDTDVNLTMVSNARVVPLNDNEFLASVAQYQNNGIQYYLIYLKRADKNPHAGQKILVVGGVGVEYNDSLSEFIAQYNADPNSKARIVYRDYAEGVAINEGYSDAEQQLYLDILSGEGPDILVNFSDSAALQSEESVVDLNPYINGANGIDRSEYFENIFSLFEKDGKMFHLPVRVSLDGFQANTELLEKRFGWTYDEFEKAAGALPEGVSFMEGTKYDELLLSLISPKMRDFIDFSKKTVNFENEDMKRFLQMAKKYGVKELPQDEGMDLEYAGDGIYYGGEDRTQEKYKAGLLAMKKASVYSLRMYCIDKDAMDGKVHFVGYPTENGKGMTVYCMLSLAISASSKYKDEAWDFIRAYLSTPIEGEGTELGIPVNRAQFDAYCRKDMEWENAQYEKMRKQMSPNDMKGYLCTISESDIDEFRELMEHAEGCEITISAISDVIKEEAAAYFAGDRTEEEVLKNIQNRAGNIVKEMS